MEEQQIPIATVGAGATAVLAASTIAYLLWNRTTSKAGNGCNNTATPPLSRQSSISTQGEDHNSLLPKLYVYFGSQTGTAQAFARQLEREGAEHGFSVQVIDLQETTTLQDLVRQDRLDSKSGRVTALFITSTYGEGEAPDNAAAFAKSLEGNIGEGNMLEGLHYGVFGLGNKQYDHFNAMAKLVDQALGTMGGKRIIDLGLGDDDCDLEGDFENWKGTKLWPTLETLYLNESDEIARKRSVVSFMPQSKYVVEYHEQNTERKQSEILLENVSGPSRPYFTSVNCPVKVVRELRSAEDAGSTVHVEIDISGQNQLQYQTADNLGVLPQNQSSIVESVACSLNYDLDQIFSLKPAPGQEWQGELFPTPITIRECLTNYCDLTSAPRRSDLKTLAAYAQDDKDKEALLQMASQDSKTQYQERILDEYAGLQSILRMFPSVSMPLEHFLTICPLTKARYYTISSSSSAHPDAIHLTVTVNTAERKNGGEIFKGLCSNHIAGQSPGGTSTLRVFTRPSTFRLPQDSSRPIILIGPGTGIAPMRALLQERSYQRQTNHPQLGGDGDGAAAAVVGPNILYFGCKKCSQDFLYQDELQAFVEAGDLDQLVVAFSRENEDQKCYVQHLLYKNAPETYKLMEEDGAYIYVCGACKMGNEVAETLQQILMEHGGMDARAAKQYLSQMAKTGRYVQELWA